MTEQQSTQAKNAAKPLTPKNNNEHFDIIISGGGLSGCLMALSLANATANAELTHSKQPLNIAIIEANPIHTDFSQSFDDRVLALSHGSANYLKQLGVWSAIQKYAQPIEKIHISDRGHYGKARMQAQDYNVSALGYVVEMSVIGQSLLKTINALTTANRRSENSTVNIRWFTPDTIKAIDWQQECVVVNLASKKQLSASLLIGCDGVNSVCRNAANIASSSTDYQQSAVIANVNVSKAHNNVAFERFTEQGPIAMLPLSSLDGEPRCSLVWTVTPELAQTINGYNDAEFAIELTKAFGTWLGEVTHAGKRTIYPLSLVQAHDQVYHRMALVGNASHTIHPIAGQGFNLGLRDVEQLSELILAENDDFGRYSMLNQYAQQRQQDQKHIIKLTDSLVTLFSNQLPPLVAGRNIALKVLNYCSPLKRALAKKTMGY